jgi:hypothetical protein
MCVHICIYVCMYVCVYVCKYVYVCLYVCMLMQFHRFCFKEQLLKGQIPSSVLVQLKQTLTALSLDIEIQNLHLAERGNCYSRNFCPTLLLPLSLASGLGTFPIDLKSVLIHHIPAALQVRREERSGKTRWPLHYKALRIIFCVRFDALRLCVFRSQSFGV